MDHQSATVFRALEMGSRRSLMQGEMDVFAEVLAGLYGFRADDHQFFPEYDANDKPMGLIKS